MSSFCADEVFHAQAHHHGAGEVLSGVDEAQRVLGGLEIKAYCKSLQRSADLAEMRVRVAALDAETDHVNSLNPGSMLLSPGFAEP